MCRAQVRLQAVPEQGCILVSHPLLRDAYSSYFHQTVVLLCRHSFASGTYGLILNRLLSANAKAKMDRMIRDQPPQNAGSSSGLDLARDMPAALQAMLGQSLTQTDPHPDSCLVTVYDVSLSGCQDLAQYVSGLEMLFTQCNAFARSSLGLHRPHDCTAPSILLHRAGDLSRKQGAAAAAAAVAVDVANESSDEDDDDDVPYLLEGDSRFEITA